MKWIRSHRFGLILVAGTLVAASCTHAIAEETLADEVQSYLNAHSQETVDASWVRAFHSRAADAMNENGSISDEASYANDKLLDFSFEKKKHFEENRSDPLTEGDKLEVAHWYLLYAKNGWAFPSRISTYLTKSNYDVYMESN